MEFEELKRAVLCGERIITLSGLTSVSAKAYVLARLFHESGKKLAVVVERNSDLDALSTDLEFFRSYFSGGDPPVIAIPSFESDP